MNNLESENPSASTETSGLDRIAVEFKRFNDGRDQKRKLHIGYALIAMVLLAVSFFDADYAIAAAGFAIAYTVAARPVS